MMAQCTAHAQLKSVYGVLGSHVVLNQALQFKVKGQVRGPGVEASEKLVLKYQRSKVTLFSLSLSFYISSERTSKGLQDGIRMKSVR